MPKSQKNRVKLGVVKQLYCLATILLLNGSYIGVEGTSLKVESQVEVELMQDSHNCNSNVDRLKSGPMDWTQIEGSGQLFTDHSFQADETMLSWKEYPRTVGGLAKYLTWFKEFKRPHDLLVMKQNINGMHSYISLFGKQFEQTGKMAAFNLEQGSVGNNYFLTVASALADRGKFVPRMFHQTRYPEEGIFTVRVFVKGRPEDINLDDQFPAYAHSTAFAKPTIDGGWWLPILEKAFAKVNVNYEMISSGTQAEAAQFLTGAPSKEFETNRHSVEEIWMSVTNAIRHEYLITTACFIEKNGLIAGHGYIVKDFIVGKDSSGDEVKLVKVKNPYKPIGDQSLKETSHGAWMGQFSSLDTVSWTPELKKLTRFDGLKTGEFFMSAEDFKDSFKYYTITYMHIGYKHSFIEKRQAVSQRVYKFNFTISDDDYNSLPLNQLAQQTENNNEVNDDENIQIPSEKDAKIKSSKILLQLKAQLNQGRVQLQDLQGQDVSPSDASDFEDAIDLMVGSDIVMGEQSESWADSEIDSEMGQLTKAETQELLELLGVQPKPTPRMKVEKQAKFDDESDEEKKDEEDYNNEDHQAHMAKKMGQQSNQNLQQSSSDNSQDVVMESGSKDEQSDDQNGQLGQSLAEDQPQQPQAPGAPQPAQQTQDQQANPQPQPQGPQAQPVQDDTESAIVSHRIKTDDNHTEFPNTVDEDLDPVQPIETKKVNTGSLHAFIGAELYNKRMFPHGCPSYQKAFVKLFKVERNMQAGTEKLKLVDSRFFNNRDGFGYMMRNLTRGDYQIHFKKYTTGFDVYDFTVRIYADKLIKLIDDEDQKITQIELSKEVIDKIPNITDHHSVKKILDEEKKSQKPFKPVQKPPIKEPLKPKSVEEGPESHYEPAGNPNFKQPIPEQQQAPAQPVQQQTPAQLQDPLEQQQPQQQQNSAQPQPAPVSQQNGQKATAPVQPPATTSQTSSQTSSLSREVLATKLKKAAALADNSNNDKFFEIHRRDDYYMKDALDKKHGYYYLRLGSTDTAQEDMTLKVKMFLKGDQLETSETGEKLFVYKFPSKSATDQSVEDFRLTTYCKIKPSQNKNTCDFLVPTSFHDRTMVYVQKNVDKKIDEEQEEQAQQGEQQPEDLAQLAILSSTSKKNLN